MKRQPDDDLEQFADDTLATAGSDKTVESSGVKQFWSVSHFFFFCSNQTRTNKAEDLFGK
jgi:hypothetical protein